MSLEPLTGGDIRRLAEDGKDKEMLYLWGKAVIIGNRIKGYSIAELMDMPIADIFSEDSEEEEGGDA
jgi:hypothetical protein